MEETGLVIPGIQDPFGPPGSLGSLASCSLGSLEHNNAAQQYINLPPGKLWESTSAQCSPVFTTSPIGTWPQGTRTQQLETINTESPQLGATTAFVPGTRAFPLTAPCHRGPGRSDNMDYGQCSGGNAVPAPQHTATGSTHRRF